MLRLFRNSHQTRSTDKIGAFNRREFLTVGAMGASGLSLANLLRMEAQAGIQKSHKAIINIHLDGGPPQHETIDPKPNAPVEIRGPFSSISSALPGFSVCELLPKLAVQADRWSFIRSLVGSEGKHHAFQCQSGFKEKDLSSLGGRPAMGCVLNKLLGDANAPAPAFIDLMQGRPLVRNSARPGFLGPSYAPFRPDLSAMFHRELESGMKGELARLGENHSLSLILDESLNVGRLGQRQSLLQQFDQVRKQVDSSGMMDAMDQFNQQAVGILTSGTLAKALDLNQEDPATIAKYTAPSNSDALASTTSEGPHSPRKFLLARRLIEAGARMVSVSISDFDTHSNNASRMKTLLPIVDHGLTTLVDDLEQRGLLDDVSIVVWGEFGRTPKINAKGGRDHWPRVGPCFMTGGGMKIGQVIGSTDRQAAAVIERPVTYKDVFATLYKNIGIDARQITLSDPQGRPQYLLDEGEPIQELS